MGNESKQRVALYLDKELVRNADIIKTKYGYKSRNDLYAKAIEAFIANEIVGNNDNAICEILAKAIEKSSEKSKGAIAQGLFRYAVQLEMLMRMYAEDTQHSPNEIRAIEREAINNVQRKRGKVNLEEIIAGYYNDYNG